MTEIGDELMQQKGSPEQDQIPFREKFHLLEDEQISIDNLIQKLQDWLNPEEKLSWYFLRLRYKNMIFFLWIIDFIGII